MKEHTPFRLTPSVIALPLFFVLLLWFVFWIEVRYALNFNSYGIYPKTFSGLRGVFLSPFLHGSLQHLYNNSLPLLVLLTALRFFYREVSYKVVLWGILFSGLFTWFIGRESYHIGASGLVYVLVSFIFFKGIQTKYYRLVALSLGVVMIYGGMIWYMFPDVEKGISWEGHLGGFLTGLGLSYWYKTPELKQPIQYDWQRPDFDPSLDPFMKNFDEHGNFNPPPKEEEIPPVESYFKTSIKIIYDFIGKKDPS